MADSQFITPFGGTIVGPVTISGAVLASNGTVSGPAYSFAGAPTYGMYFDPTAGVAFAHGGTAVFSTRTNAFGLPSTSSIGWSSGAIGATIDTIIAREAAASVSVANAGSTAKVTLTVPTGTANVSPVVVSDPATRKVAATNAQTIGSFTVGAADATFRVSANILVTTATTHSFTVTCAYTDEGNTSRTLTLNFSTLAGVISNTAIGNAGGTVPYNGVVQHIRCKAATTITIATTGTFTTVVYNGEGIIEKVT